MGHLRWMGVRSWGLRGVWVVKRHLGAISRKLGARKELTPGDSREREWHTKERRQEGENTGRCEDSLEAPAPSEGGSGLGHMDLQCIRGKTWAFCCLL